MSDDIEYDEYKMLMNQGGKFAVNYGETIERRLKDEELDISRAIILSCGQLEAACHVFTELVKHVHPLDARKALIEDVLMSMQQSLVKPLCQGEDNEEQCGQDGNTTEDNKEEIQKSHSNDDVPPGDEDDPLGS